MPLLSVLLCTHNPKENLFRRTLAALQAQTLPGTDWELLIIDNLSQPPLREHALLNATNAQGLPLRIVVEEKLGLTPARLRGIHEARGDILVFVDDDNLLEPAFLAEVLRIAREYPQLGAWGGTCIGEYEQPPQAELSPYLGYLAVREVKSVYWSNEYRFDTVPFGAGLCIRRSIALSYAERCARSPERAELDRKGNSLVSGGDSDLAFTAIDEGYGLGLFPSLSLTHVMPAFRTGVDYLERLLEGIASSTPIVAKLHGMSLPAPAALSFPDRLLHAYRMRRQHPSVQRLEKALTRGRAKGLEQAARLKGQTR